MVGGSYINGMLVLGIDYGTGTGVTFVRRLGSGTGEQTIEMISGIPTTLSTMQPAPVIEEPEPPPQKKSWHQQQKELPKFLRPKRKR